MPAKSPRVDRRVVVVRWIVLLVASVILGGGLEHLRLPAALLAMLNSCAPGVPG